MKSAKQSKVALYRKIISAEVYVDLDLVFEMKVEFLSAYVGNTFLSLFYVRNLTLKIVYYCTRSKG